MKTQIIQLEPHDDTISVKDKMDWSQTPRVLLVWPQRGKVLRNRLDLVLLERYCSAHGSQLALLTKDQEIIFQAAQAGIPVFQNRKSAQLQPWGKSFREFKRQEMSQKAQQTRFSNLVEKEKRAAYSELLPWMRISIFTIAVLAVLAIAATLLPSASVTIPQESYTHRITIPIKAYPGETHVRISGSIPARDLLILVEDQDSLPTSGTQPYPSDYARGEVVFTNLSEDPIQINENTILSTDGENPILFETTFPGYAPAGNGEQITIPVRALEPGSQGNLAANQITRINLSLGTELSVSNPQPTSGGEDIYLPAPSEQDREKLSNILLGNLKQLALKQSHIQLSPRDILLSSEPDLDEIITNNFLPEEGSTGDTLTLISKIRFRVYYAAEEDLKSLAVDAINAQYTGSDYVPILESIRLNQLSDPHTDAEQTASWDMEVEWEDRRILNQQEIIQVILGKKPIEAKRLLQEYLQMEHSPKIGLYPDWWVRIPALPFRITIIQEGGNYNE